MKTYGHPCSRWWVIAILPLSLAAAEPKSAPPKTHVLFMGADLMVERDKKPYRIEDVSGSQFKIVVDGQEIFVPTRNRQTGLGVAYNLKLTGTSVKLDGLEAGPGYTAGNDPMNKLKETAGQGAAMGMMQERDEAEVARLAQTQTQLEIAIAAGGYGVEENKAQLVDVQADMRRTQSQLDSTRTVNMGDVANVGAGAHRMQVEQGNYDAMVLSFKVSSETELTSPYMVALFRFHDPAAKPGVDGLVIHAQALDPIGTTPRYVRVLRGGLPEGFQFLDCTVHIYNRGRELATNFSEKRVDLTHGEAQQYYVMEYVSANKKTTSAAAAVPGSLPLTQRQQLNPEQLTRTLHAKVAKDGSLLGVYTDADCNHPLKDAGMAAAAGELFFKPALDHGTPIDGVVRLRLADF